MGWGGVFAAQTLRWGEQSVSQGGCLSLTGRVSPRVGVLRRPGGLVRREPASSNASYNAIREHDNG